MSFRGRNRGKNSEIELNSVIAFLHVLLCMAAGITVMTLIGMVLSLKVGQNAIVYQMTLAVNAMMLFGGSVSLKMLKMKNQKIEEKKEK